MIKLGKLKKAFHEEGIQISTGAINLLNLEVNRTIERWINNTKRANVKRLKPENIWIALNKFD